MVRLFMDAGYTRADAEDAAAAAAIEDASEKNEASIGRLIALDQVIDRPKGEKFTCQALIGSGTWSRVYSALGEGGAR